MQTYGLQGGSLSGKLTQLRIPFWSSGHKFRQEVRFLGYVMSSHVVLTLRYSSDFHFTSMLKTSVSMTHQLVWQVLWSNMKRLMEVKVMSKSQRIVKKSKKAQRSEKFAKTIRSEEHLPKHQSSVNWKQRTRASVTALWQFFELFLLSPRALSIPCLEQLSLRQN